jgi:leucyl/phenylalanyl-tRNA--protein transferase
VTDHLAQFGAREISRAHYRGMLAEALDAPADFYDLATRGATGGATGGAAGAAVLQAISHTS